MPKINHVAKAQKDQGTCGKCGVEIRKGDPYRWLKIKFGGRKIRCTHGDCDFKASDKTNSEFLSQVYDLNDRVSELTNITDLDELVSEIENLVEEYNSLADDCEEKLNNMPEGLQQGSTGEMLQERADGCRECADSLDGTDRDFDEDTWREEALETLDIDDVHLKELTEEVMTRLRAEAKENAERDKKDLQCPDPVADEAWWYTELTESYVEQGLTPEEFEEKVVEAIDEKREEFRSNLASEAEMYSYEGQ